MGIGHMIRIDRDQLADIERRLRAGEGVATPEDTDDFLALASVCISLAGELGLRELEEEPSGLLEDGDVYANVERYLRDVDATAQFVAALSRMVRSGDYAERFGPVVDAIVESCDGVPAVRLVDLNGPLPDAPTPMPELLRCAFPAGRGRLPAAAPPNTPAEHPSGGRIGR